MEEGDPRTITSTHLLIRPRACQILQAPNRTPSVAAAKFPNRKAAVLDVGHCF